MIVDLLASERTGFEFLRTYEGIDPVDVVMAIGDQCVRPGCDWEICQTDGQIPEGYAGQAFDELATNQDLG